MTKRRCGEPFPTRTITVPGMPTRCNLPTRHDGNHYGETSTTAVEWVMVGGTVRVENLRSKA